MIRGNLRAQLARLICKAEHRFNCTLPIIIKSLSLPSPAGLPISAGLLMRPQSAGRLEQSVYGF